MRVVLDRARRLCDRLSRKKGFYGRRRQRRGGRVPIFYSFVPPVADSDRDLSAGHAVDCGSEDHLGGDHIEARVDSEPLGGIHVVEQLLVGPPWNFRRAYSLLSFCAAGLITLQMVPLPAP